MFRTLAVATLWSAVAVDAATAAGTIELLRRESSDGAGDSRIDATGIDSVPVSLVERDVTILTPPGGSVSAEEKTALEKAYAMSQDIARKVISAMKAGTSKSLEESYFPGMSATQRKEVLGKMTGAQTVLANPILVYPGPVYQCGRKGRLAATTLGSTTCATSDAFTKKCNRDASGRKYIYVCQYWYDKFKKKPEDQGGAIFHEAVHHAGVTKDLQYYRDQATKLSLTEALTNCPSYEFLAMDIFAPATRRAQGKNKGQGKVASKNTRRRGEKTQ